MFNFLRVRGMAAAFLILAATMGFASPSRAQVAGPSYLDHEVAALDGSALLPEALEPQAIAPVPILTPSQQALARIAALYKRPDPMSAPPAPAVAAVVLTLGELVDSLAGTAISDPEHECLAEAVYFESRSEPVEGQLAVARVVLNRAASGRYPPLVCDVVKQPAQFSFIRDGKFPKADRNSQAWRKAVAISHIARAKLASAEIASNVLWYHATYVTPSWGKRLKKQAQIGLHIFYS